MPQPASLLCVSWCFLLGPLQTVQPGSVLAWTVVVGVALAVGLALLRSSPRRFVGAAVHEERGAALRRRARAVAVVAQRDPGARGRTRPRAPTHAWRADALVTVPGC